MPSAIERPLPDGFWIGAGSVLGAGGGLVVGILLERIALGIAGGAAVGLLVGALLTTAAATPAPRRRTVLAIAAAILAIGAVTTAIVAVG